MNHQEQLAWEKRVGVYAAVAAFASALMGAAALAVGASLQSKTQVSDVVDAILFLEFSPYITGEILHVDGGLTAGR